MRIVLDECVNRRLKRSFTLPGVVHVSDVGLDTLKDGALLHAAEKDFDVLVTIDKSMPFQTNLSGIGLAVLVLDARNNSLPELRLFVPELERVLPSLEPGRFLVLRRLPG